MNLSTVVDELGGMKRNPLGCVFEVVCGCHLFMFLCVIKCTNTRCASPVSQFHLTNPLCFVEDGGKDSRCCSDDLVTPVFAGKPGRRGGLQALRGSLTKAADLSSTLGS